MLALEAPNGHRSNMNALRLFASVSLLPLVLLACSDDDDSPTSAHVCDGGQDAASDALGSPDYGGLGYDAGDNTPDASWDVVLPGPYDPDDVRAGRSGSILRPIALWKRLDRGSCVRDGDRAGGLRRRCPGRCDL
ncbi:MAG: hypothetical protein ACI9KE_000239 [Polyangiales bacterium]|jgi:hypothetical protein